MASTTVDWRKYCALYPNCRRTPAKFCFRKLCGMHCDRLSPCSPANHDKHGTQSRGTNDPSDAKRQRRSWQAVVQAIVDGFMETSPWFSERLQITGYTKRKFTLLIYDHLMLMASALDSSGSPLSFTMTPAELLQIEEEIEPVVKSVSNAELSELSEIAERESKADANHEMQQEHIYGMVIDPTIVDSIRVSFEHIVSPEERFQRIAWRQELFQRLRSPASERLLQHGRRVGLTDEAIVRLVNKVCPLPFVDETQYHTFSDDLAVTIRKNLWPFRDKLMRTVAGRLSGFQIIISGTSATLYSETPGVKRGRLFDAIGKGKSDMDVTIVFETAQSKSDTQSQALVQAIFFERRSRSAEFKSIQYGTSQVQKRFQLDARFVPSWQEQLGRVVNVNVAYSSRTHGNGVLTFQRHYDFSWGSVTSSGMGGSEYASSTPVSSVYQLARSTSSFQDLIRPDPKNKRPMRKGKNDPHPYEVHSHYQRDVPKRFSSASPKDLRFLDRGMDTPDINFNKMEMWLQARNVFECFREVKIKDYEWARNPKWPDTHRHGVWFKCLLKQEAIFPALSKNEIGVKLDADGNLAVPLSHRSWGRFEKGIHASSVYQVKRTLATGLHAGIAKKHDLSGVYCFNMSNDKLAFKSMGYAMYSELFDDNIYWAPHYELQIMRSCGGTGHIGKITAGDQWVCKEELSPGFGPMFHLTAVWFHALPLSDLGKEGCNWVSLDSFHKEYELD
jgi:hypothetical protein